ncbi:hypothetical protein B0A54_05353 [Friedmanniomyces endolithicus]|uniref:Uncharacterized protein n=1 Tax=Friedmanniomyces endolithicus TaxID=329885 RepID=A0A4U0V4F9_9PEZI|nr:hypothetical protein LTS09_010894 [Friedmanniomyces endolithicus]TKA43571.1 hypothetical protein B0A54_05353 [Friedmanniomyces endolithicus]
MSSESTPTETYQAEVRAFLTRQMSDISTTAEMNTEDGKSEHTEWEDLATFVASDEAQGDDGLYLVGAEAAGKQEPSKWTFFSGNDDEHRYRRLRCGMLLAAFNSQPLSASMQDRAKAWSELTKPDSYGASQLPERVPVVKSPFYIDYGNVRIAETAFIHRAVYLGDNPLPEAAIVIGEGAIICPNVQILTIKHDVDWRQRDGFNGPSWASGVTIGCHVYIANGATILPGCSIGDGCVVGAGAVVSQPIPAYHVAVGNPARAVWKVALDVPDAEDLIYQRDGDRMLVVQEGYKASEEALSRRLPDDDTQATDVLLESHQEDLNALPSIQFQRSMRAPSSQTYPATARSFGYRRREDLKSEEREIERAVIVDIALLVVAVVAGWTVVHFALY